MRVLRCGDVRECRQTNRSGTHSHKTLALIAIDAASRRTSSHVADFRFDAIFDAIRRFAAAHAAIRTTESGTKRRVAGANQVIDSGKAHKRAHKVVSAKRRRRHATRHRVVIAHRRRRRLDGKVTLWRLLALALSVDRRADEAVNFAAKAERLVKAVTSAVHALVVWRLASLTGRLHLFVVGQRLKVCVQKAQALRARQSLAVARAAVIVVVLHASALVVQQKADVACLVTARAAARHHAIHRHNFGLATLRARH